MNELVNGALTSLYLDCASESWTVIERGMATTSPVSLSGLGVGTTGKFSRKR